VTNVVEKVVEKPVAAAVATTNAPTATPPPQPTTVESQVPPGYRVWTDYNGRKIIAKWTGVAVDESGITIITRYNRRIDAVLWKFAQEDQAYIKDEIKKHAARGEVMSDGAWIRNPILKNQ